jgi:hypothetical protein
MIQKTRYILIGILIGVLTTLGGIALIVMLTIGPLPHKHYIPIYPNSNNVVRSIRYEANPNVFITTGVLLDQTTTFQTSDAATEIRAYYLTAYQAEYKCASRTANSNATNAAFICTETTLNGTITTYKTYTVEITISPTSSPVKTVSVVQVHRIQQPGDL